MTGLPYQQEVPSTEPVEEGDEGEWDTVGHPGRSGYPQSSGRVVRVLKSSGNKICYPQSAPKINYPQFRVPAISGSGSGLPNIPEINKITVYPQIAYNFA
jgi:hypothetical protein